MNGNDGDIGTTRQVPEENMVQVELEGIEERLEFYESDLPDLR